MNILALDLGTKTGYAYGVAAAGNPCTIGTWKLASAKEIREWGKTRITRRCDPRPMRLYRRLCELGNVPDILIFEDVNFSSYTLQTQLWASLRTAVWMFAYKRDVPHVDCVPVKSLKLFATNFGGASKEQMAKALKLVAPGLVSARLDLDDNAIDAVWLWKWADLNLCRMKSLTSN